MNAIEIIEQRIPKFYDIIIPTKITKEGRLVADNREKEFWG